MRMAELLSDLTSLRPGLCDSNAALALVNARAGGTGSTQPSNSDDDLERVKDLIELHSKVKSAQSSGGIDQELSQAREAVANVRKQS